MRAVRVNWQINEMKAITQEYFNWLSLKGFGKNKFVLNTTIFLFLTPLFYKFKLFIEQAVSKYIEKEISIEIPFSWQLLFYAAILFGIGTLLFRIYCPRLLYQFSCLGDYEYAGNYISQLHPYIENIKSEESLQKYFDISLLKTNQYSGKLPDQYNFLSAVKDRAKLDRIFYIYSEYYKLNKTQVTYVRNDLEKTKEKRQFLDIYFKNLFSIILYETNKHNRIARIVIGLLYLSGSFLVIITLFQNLIFVVQQSFN